MKLFIVTVVSILFILPVTTNAESITNNNGIVISEQEYNDFLKIYSSDYIMHMSVEKYNKLKELNFDDVTTVTKYVETAYNPSLHLTTEKEVTEEEYNNFNAISPLLDDAAVSTETQMKKLVMSIVGGTTYNYVTTSATWKVIPSTRSFDVIGYRGVGFEFRDGSQQGQQIYTLDGNYTIINYAWNGTNIKKFSDGFGISMNIVNSNITQLQLIVECDVKPTITHPSIYTSYQHAQESLTLADSQNYTLGGAGLGSVFVYPYSISSKYDAMTGVHVDY